MTWAVWMHHCICAAKSCPHTMLRSLAARPALVSSDRAARGSKSDALSARPGARHPSLLLEIIIAARKSLAFCTCAALAKKFANKQERSGAVASVLGSEPKGPWIESTLR